MNTVMHNLSHSPAAYVSRLLCCVTLLVSLFLSSTIVSAEDSSVVDEINIAVPISCTISGTGMNTHNATINNGQYNSAIGETTMRAFCNDSEGFAIYAIGYTDNTDGKNVLTNSGLGPTYDIATGTQTTGNNSGWAMKLSTIASPEPTYPITIQDNFTSFQEIPDDYTLVAKRESSTDTGANAEGSTLKSTYQTYISPTQPAGTYTGQVKYIMVHPNYVDESAIRDTVTVLFDGNGLTFPDGTTTNTVKYGYVCKPGDYVYVGNNYQEVMTSNILPGGIQDGSYTDNENILQTITLTGADKIKVDIDYGITTDSIGIAIIEGTWDGDFNNPAESYYEIGDNRNNVNGKKSYTIEGDTVTIYTQSWNTPESGYDYGFYVKIYPVYNTEQPNTTYEQSTTNDCSLAQVSGSYSETTAWLNRWDATIMDANQTFKDTKYSSASDSLMYYLERNYDTLKGTTITLYAHNPYIIRYDGNGASNEFGMDTHFYYVGHDEGWEIQELSVGDEVTLIAPNYKRTGYGFIGWSVDANAASRIRTSTIYGPDETITIDDSFLNHHSGNGSREITLYAIWLPSSGTIQNWSSCSSMTVGDVTALTDTRDNDTYAVAKLADGNCWMIENLRLGGNSSITLTTADTQTAGILPADNSTSWQSSDIWQNIETKSTTSPDSVVHSINQLRNYAYGNHYSWATAINSTESIPIGSEATTSICPAGWRLPSKQLYDNLINELSDSSEAVTSNNMRTFPNNFTYSGWVTGSSPSTHINYTNHYYGKGAGNYWTSTSVSNDTVVHHLSLFQYSVRTSGNNFEHTMYGVDGRKSDGLTIRCILPIST